LYWQYRTINRGGPSRRSLVEMLEDDPNVQDPASSLSFFSLRAHEVCGKHALTEQVYIHSKLMIVDDHLVLVGSANLNDRSMLGKRDSELCLRLEDAQWEAKGELFGDPWPLTGRLAKALRVQLLQEHFGLLDEARGDFLRHFGVLEEVASQNTSIFDAVFRCLPNNGIKTLSELRRALQREEEEEEEEEVLPKMTSCRSLDIGEDGDKAALEQVRGRAVFFPLEFLSRATKLKPPNGVVISDEIFT
jgi:phospholipase D1/2